MADNQLEFHSPRTLMAVSNQLPTAEDRSIYWQDPNADGPTPVEIDTHKAVFNPDSGEMYSVVTDDYQIINPPQFMGPLVEQLRDRERNDVNGKFLVYDQGASAYGELLFETDKIWPSDRNRSDEPIRVGMEIRYSHDGGVSVRASGFAQDGMCKNTMRQVTDSVYVKHAGDVDKRVNWEQEWSNVLSQLGVFSENLATVIEEAFGYEMFEDGFDSEMIEAVDPPQKFEDVLESTPSWMNDRDVHGFFSFFELLGFPNYIALEATDRLVWRMTKRGDGATSWDAYSALTYALTHFARFDAGSTSDDKYHRIASDVLTNPAKVEEDALREAYGRLQPDDEAQDQLGIESNIGEALTAYQEREEQLRTALESSD